MICSCECEINPKIRIVTFRITSAIVTTGKLDLFILMNEVCRYKLMSNSQTIS